MENNLKHRAILLRKQGLSYSEIKQKVNVSKSTLSLWLRDIELNKTQKQRLLIKAVRYRSLGSKALRDARIKKSLRIIDEAKSQIEGISAKDKFLIGNILYWAEGHKQKDHNPSRGVSFNNSDPKMIKLFIMWLKNSLNIDENDICFEIYIHTTYQKPKRDLVAYWSAVTGFPTLKFDKIYLKHNKVRSYRKNRGADYFGLLRVSVRRSTDLNRKISGWIDGIYEQWGVV